MCIRDRDKFAAIENILLLRIFGVVDKCKNVKYNVQILLIEYLLSRYFTEL